jgi:hypothetical protein
MTKRTPVSAQQNVWFDAQAVDDIDLTLEQNYNNTIESSIINNHVGSGVLPEVLIQNVIFDSLLAQSIGFLDGIAVYPQNQPVDTNYGNQLEISLTDSNVAGRKAVKLAIIGLDFESNLQYEIFYFKHNEIQISRKHFTQVLVILFNDFIGDPNYSFNLGGRIIIREAQPLTLSRSTIMVAQDVEPNLFFRDFFFTGYPSLSSFLQAALPLYDISSLNITINPKDNKILLSGDVTTQIGQKFIATTNNIQKATLLLSVENNATPTNLTWDGDLVVSIYPLQSSIECPSDIAPNLAIDFSPYNVPVAQVSVNYDQLLVSGIVLNTVPQPVDFVFSNSSIASGNVIVAGNYYALTVKRSGSTQNSDILIATGSDRIENSRVTLFTTSGNLWVDIPEEDLWFRIWTDAAKVSDGQAYDSGRGIILPKTTQDPISLATIDYSLENLQFTGNDVFRGVVSATTQLSDSVPDERTGNPVLSRQQTVPNIQLLNTIDITNLQSASEPLIIGAIADKNIKSYDPTSALISSHLRFATIVNDELIVKIIDNDLDPNYDSTVSALQTELLNGSFVGAKIIPNSNNTNIIYRIADAKLCSMLVGDVNGDGIIDGLDRELLESYIGFDLNYSLPLNTTYIAGDGYVTGYTTCIVPFAFGSGISFRLINPVTQSVVASASDGYLVPNPNDSRLANFTSAAINFSIIPGLSSYKLVLLTPSTSANYGTFDIASIDSALDVLTIRKVFLNSETLLQILRADVDSDGYVSAADGYLLNQYIDRAVVTEDATYPLPPYIPTTRIGTSFNVIRFKLENISFTYNSTRYIDRTDDYSFLGSGRPLVVHPAPDIFTDGYSALQGYYFAQHDFSSSNFIPFLIQKQLVWDESLVVTNSRARLVPSIFSTIEGFQVNSCTVDGVTCSVYPATPDFDSGRVDYFVPNNLILGGEITRPTGDYYKVDFEVGTIVLEIPDGVFDSERTIDILGDFVVDATPVGLPSRGLTRLGFPAMRFSDCTLVTSDALANNQIRFSVAVQSFSPNTNGLSSDGYYGAIVDGKMGVAIDYATGLLHLNFTNLYEDSIQTSLNTKVQIQVFLKKGGFNNVPLFIDSTKVSNMLDLMPRFSGVLSPISQPVIDLENQTSGVLPIERGGTELNSVGPAGTILVSNGSSLSYQSINPIYVNGFTGIATTSSASYVEIGAISFSFAGFITPSTVRFEAILDVASAGPTAQLRLATLNTNTTITVITTTSTSRVLVTSTDIKSLLASSSESLYRIELLSSTGAANVSCRMARLVLTY